LANLLTKKRKEWAKPRSNVVFRGKPLNYNASLQEKYVKELTALVVQMAKQSNREIIRLFKQEGYLARDGVALDANISSQARILTNALKGKFESLFGRKAKPLAQKMVSSTNKLSKSQVHQSLKELSGGLSIKTDILPESLKTIMTASVTENVSLIKSIASEYLDSVQGEVMRSIIGGGGLETLIPALEKREGMTLRRAKNIALDQTRKVNSAINRERMTAIGVKKFEWIHSGGGQHPREEHVAMSGNIYSYDDPPVIDSKTGEKGYPGTAINCRCIARPIIEFDSDN
jgi:SPP1 gp7 family putative phage head morphogenesis protein